MTLTISLVVPQSAVAAGPDGTASFTVVGVNPTNASGSYTTVHIVANDSYGDLTPGSQGTFTYGDATHQASISGTVDSQGNLSVDGNATETVGNGFTPGQSYAWSVGTNDTTHAGTATVATVVVTVTPDCSAPYSDTGYNTLTVSTQGTSLDPNQGFDYTTTVGDPSLLNHWDYVDDGLPDSQGNLDVTGTVTDRHDSPWAVGSDYVWSFNYPGAQGTTVPFTLSAGLCDPTAAFTVTPDSTDPMTINVDGSASTTPAGLGGYSYDWGDGTITPASGYQSAAAASHTYATPGTYTVTETVQDVNSNTAQTTQQVTVSQTAPNAPVANDDPAMSVNGTTPTDLPVLANDTGSNLSIAAGSVTAPTQGGTATIDGNRVLYTAPSDASVTTDTFIYEVTDGTTTSAPAKVTVAISRPPVTAPDHLTVKEFAAATKVDVLANDSDPNGDTLSVTVGQPFHGVTKVANGVLTYKPNWNYHGKDSFIYWARDSHGGVTDGEVSIVVEQEPTATPVKPRIQRVSTVMHRTERFWVSNTPGVKYVLKSGQNVSGTWQVLRPLQTHCIHPVAVSPYHLNKQRYGWWCYTNTFNPKFVHVVKASGYALAGNGRVRVDTIGASIRSSKGYRVYYKNGKHVAPFKYVRPGQTGKIVGKLRSSARYLWFRNHRQTMVLVYDRNNGR